METKISVKDLMMQAFLTGWELSDKSISQDEYLQSSIDVIEVLQVEPENVYAEEGLGLPDGEEVDHLDDLLRADGQWLYYGVEEENFFLIQWYPDVESANAKLAELEAMGDGSKQYLVDSASSGRTPRGPRTLETPTLCSSGPDLIFSGFTAKGNLPHAAF